MLPAFCTFFANRNTRPPSAVVIFAPGSTSTKLRLSLNSSGAPSNWKLGVVPAIELVRPLRKSLSFRFSVDAINAPVFTCAVRPNRMPFALIR